MFIRSFGKATFNWLCLNPRTTAHTCKRAQSFHDGSVARFRPNHLPPVESGEVFPGRLRFRLRPEARKKTGLFPKPNRMTHPPHSVKVETQVMQGVQDLSQHFIGSIEVSQIGPRVTPANPAAAIGIERTGVISIARLLDRNLSLRCK